MDTIEAWMQEAVTSKHKGNTTRAWGDNQELLYVIKCLANLPNTSITQWCSLHQLPFCLTILTQCKPNNQNQTSKPRHQCCVIVCECALLLQKNLHLGLTKLFSLKVDGETFCCYLKVPITLSQFQCVSKIYTCLRRFAKKKMPFFASSFCYRQTKSPKRAQFPPFWIQKGAVERLGTN